MNGGDGSPCIYQQCIDSSPNNLKAWRTPAIGAAEYIHFPNTKSEKIVFDVPFVISRFGTIQLSLLILSIGMLQYAGIFVRM